MNKRPTGVPFRNLFGIRQYLCLFRDFPLCCLTTRTSPMLGCGDGLEGTHRPTWQLEHKKCSPCECRSNCRHAVRVKFKRVSCLSKRKKQKIKGRKSTDFQAKSTFCAWRKRVKNGSVNSFMLFFIPPQLSSPRKPRANAEKQQVKRTERLQLHGNVDFGLYSRWLNSRIIAFHHGASFSSGRSQACRCSQAMTA